MTLKEIRRAPKNPAAVPDTRTEFQRFLDMAREVEADETPGALDRAFEKVIRNSAEGVSPEEAGGVTSTLRPRDAARSISACLTLTNPPGR